MGRKPETWRLIAYIRELASLGCGGAQAARMLGVSDKMVWVLGSQNRISFRANRAESALRRAIRDGYASGKSPAEIAREVGSPETSIKSLASQMGLTRHTVRDPFKHKRIFKVPADRMDEYRSLRRLGMTFRECGYEMGLLERPSPRIPSNLRPHFASQENA